MAKCTFERTVFSAQSRRRTENALLRASRVNICESFHRVISTGLRRTRIVAFLLLALCPHESASKATDLIIAPISRSRVVGALFLAALYASQSTVTRDCVIQTGTNEITALLKRYPKRNRCRYPIRILYSESYR